MKTLIKDVSKVSVILRAFFIYIWLTVLSELSGTDTYYSVYLLCAILGILCLYDNYKSGRVCSGGNRSVLQIFSALFSFAVVLANYALFDPLSVLQNLFDAACCLFDEAWDGVTPLRQLGVQVTRLSREPYQQYDLFSGMSPQQFEKKLRLDETVDALRDKFGEDILRRGKFAQSPGLHMAGGLHKDRRTGVTKPVPKEFLKWKNGKSYSIIKKTQKEYFYGYRNLL